MARQSTRKHRRNIDSIRPRGFFDFGKNQKKFLDLVTILVTKRIFPKSFGKSDEKWPTLGANFSAYKEWSAYKLSSGAIILRNIKLGLFVTLKYRAKIIFVV